MLLVVAGAIVSLFIFSRPLNESDIHALAYKRRNSAISAYYTFDTEEYWISPEAKKKMQPHGSLYELSSPTSLSSFPSFAAALLKYKKHEWIIIGFEREGLVVKLWVNKGQDSERAYLKLSLSSLLAIANEQNCTTVLFLHNHPNPNPSQFSTSRPSENDLAFAQTLANLLVPEGINLLAFICERGRHYEYWRSIHNEFLPIESFVKAIEQEASEANWWKNLMLRMELLR